MLKSIECYHGDHSWRGGSTCHCGARLRCICGRFVREDGFDAHYPTCPVLAAEYLAEVADLESRLP